MVNEAKREFILGFLAGEGSFQIDLQIQEDRARYNVRAIPKVSLLVHEGEILDKIQEMIGGIRSTYGEQHRLDIRKNETCRRLISIIEGSNINLFSSTKKYNQYLLWKEAVHIKNREVTKQSTKRLIELSFKAGMPDKRKRSVDDYIEIVNKSGDYVCGGTTKNGSTCERHVSKPNNTCQWH